MTELYLIRHAEAEGNIYRRLHGQYDSLITENGLRQIAALRERFADIPIDACYASDLFRTRKTAEAVYLPKGLPLQTDRRLREVFMGCWEDVTFGWLEAYCAQDYAEFSASPRTWHIEGSERFDTVVSRCMEALEEIARKNDGKRVAVFSHASAIARIHCFLGGTERAPFCDNTAVTLLRYDRGTWQTVFQNDNAHIPPEISTFERQKWWRRGGSGRDFNMQLLEQGEGCWISTLHDEPVGRVRADLETGTLLEIEMDAAHRGVALGPQLLGQVVSTLRSRGVTALRADVSPAHPAWHFFAEQGFRTDGETAVKQIGIPKE